MKAIYIILASLLVASPSFACEKHKSPRCHKQPTSIKATGGSATSKSSSTANSSSTSASTSVSSVKNSNSAQTGASISQAVQNEVREYPAAVQPQYGPVASSTANDFGPDFGATQLEIALAGRRWFNRAALESLASGVKIVGGYKAINNSPLKTPAADWMHLVILDNPALYPGIDKPFAQRTADVRGISEGQATAYGNTLVGNFAFQALQAMDDGCNVFVVYSQGYTNWDTTSGGGIGFAAVRASDTGAGAGGTGWARAEAGRYARSSIGGVGIVDSLLSSPKR